MRQLLFILTISLTAGACYSQTNIWGQYINHDGAYRSIDLRPDNIYYSDFGDRCGGTSKDTGLFIIIADTIFLKSNDKSIKQNKLFIFKESNIYLFTDTVTNLSSGKKIPICLWQPNTLVSIFQSDSLLSKNIQGRLSDHEALSGSGYTKQVEYYGNGRLSFNIQTSDKTKIITYYYTSGQVRSIEHYYNGRKTGDWYFYKENGQIEKIETYKRDKHRRLKKNAL